MRVGVWGWFHTGNFGDELIALYCCRLVEELGMRPVVFGMRRELALRHGVETVEGLDAFFGSIAFCLFAEGGCLIDVKDSMNKKGERYDELADAAERHGVTLYPFSIGGSGLGEGTRVVGGIERLWERGVCGEAVVRLEGDVALVESFGGEAIYLPDMLWDAARCFGVGRERDRYMARPLRLGVNFLRNRISKRFESFVADNLPEGVEIYFVTVNTEERVRGEITARVTSDRVHNFYHRDPLDLLRFVGTLDLLISGKLHVGLTGLSLGTRFISCRGRDKTRAMLGALGEGLVKRKEMELLAQLFADPELIPAWDTPWERIAEEKEASRAHAGVLERWALRHGASVGV
ncbi:MAG: hypothetical protein AAGD22_17490 [Verrucomicrobiota bacterium]